MAETITREGKQMKLGIVINLDDLRSLMREFIDEHPPLDRPPYEWRFETFLQWLKLHREIKAGLKTLRKAERRH